MGGRRLEAATATRILAGGLLAGLVTTGCAGAVPSPQLPDAPEAIVSSSSSTTSSSTTATSTSTSSTTTTMMVAAPAGSTAASVTTVVDGDTIEVLLPGGTQEPVRLIGINAPEEDECLAPEATAFLADLVGGEQVALEADVSDRDQFGRLLRYVYLGDVFVNEVLVREGYAIARRYEPDTALAEVLEAAQADAQQRQAGMWSPAACGPAGASSLQILEVVADAPGDDNHNLNGEWVTIENSGTSPVDLSGWVLKDESAGHRFGFPAGFVLLAGERVSVHSGCGTDGSRKLYWCNQGSAVWNNSGDTAFLLDPSGNIAASRSYGRPPTSAAPTTVATPATAATAGRSACDSSYPDVCVAPYPPDLDCGEITHRRFRVIQPDPHGFDGEGDGVGCES